MTKLKAKKPEDAKPSKPKIIVFGASGVGKTWCALSFPNVYFIDCEGGANLPHYTKRLKESGGVYLGVEDGAKDFPTVIEQVKLLATTKHNYKTLVIDSVSELMLLYIATQSEKMMLSGSDMTKTYGAEKKPAVAYARQLINWVQRLDMNVILICHEKGEWVNEKQVGMTFDFWDKAEYILHLALRITKQGGSRKAFVRKSRLEQFADATTFDWSYEEFSKRYGKDVIESEPEALKLVTPEQLTRINKLNEILKTTEEEKEKHFKYANSESYDDMETSKAEFIITRLEAKIA